MKNDKGKNVLITIFVSIIILLLIIIFLIYNGTLKLEIIQNNEEKNENLNIKINENLEYVYDASYSYDNKYTEFDRTFTENENGTKKIIDFGLEVEYTDGMQYLKNLKIPYINIDSYDAGQVNKELEQLYIENAKTFDSCAEDKIIGCTQILTYRTYTYESILSVVVIESIQGTSPWVLNYKIYNFDLTTGNKLTYEETLSKTNYELNETTNKLEQLIKEKMDSIYGEHIGDLSKACYSTDGNLDNNKVNCYEKANQLLNESIKDNSILYFIDNSGELNVLAIAYYNGVQNGELNHYLIKIPNNKNN